MMAQPPEAYMFGDMPMRIALIAESYQRLIGKPLVAECSVKECSITALWRAPFVIVAHDTAEDARFFFANAAALTAFDTDLDQFIGMPSRFSAEQPDRAERQMLLDRVGRDGFITDYAGVRITAKGRKFRICGATVWNLVDTAGQYHGQAACFEQ